MNFNVDKNQTPEPNPSPTPSPDHKKATCANCHIPLRPESITTLVEYAVEPCGDHFHAKRGFLCDVCREMIRPLNKAYWADIQADYIRENAKLAQLKRHLLGD